MINEDNEPEDSDEEIAYLLDKVSLIDGYLDRIMPPERNENGELITSENKQCEETMNHFEEYIWPLLYLDKYNKYCEMLGVTEIPENRTYIIEQQKYSAYLSWLREAYGPSGRETFWATSDNYINLLYYEVTDIKGTLKKALNQIVLGDYSEDVTILGTAGQIVISIFGLDLYADVTSITYDAAHWEFDWGHAGKTGLDIAALLPLVGSLKYADEFKALSKLSEAKAAETLSDSVDSINDMLKSGKSIDEIKAAEKLKILDEVNTLASSEITRIAGKYNNLECVECADDIIKQLNKYGLDYKQQSFSIKGLPNVSDTYLNVYSDTVGGIITENGFHTGILFNGKIYDNIHKNGITLENWLQDMSIPYDNGSVDLLQLYRAGLLEIN